MERNTDVTETSVEERDIYGDFETCTPESLVLYLTSFTLISILSTDTTY
jgi:hypothetical protein